MEVEDVSSTDYFVKILERQKAILQTSKYRKGERPTDRKSLAQLVHMHMIQSAQTAMVTEQRGGQVMRSSFVAAPYLPSIAPMSQLNKIYIRDLQLETHHRGLYAILRVATPPVTMTSVITVMEDEKKDGVTFQLYHQEDSDDRLCQEIMPMERVCILKEPYFKVMTSGGYGLRVDHPGDIIWLYAGDERIPLEWRARNSNFEKTAEKVKEEGNLALKAGKLSTAIEKYTSALEYAKTTETSRIIKLNRSLAHLRLRYYDNALEDAGKLIENEHQSEKGYYRAALSLYELGRFQESNEALESLLSQYPDSEAGKREIARTRQRLREQEHGEFDFRAMYKAAEIEAPCLDIATFVGNIEIRASKGRGRGLFTTKDVKAGELLLCEKAFSYCSAEHSKTTLLVNIHTNRMIMGTQADLITQAIQKMIRNPSLAPAFTSLYHGDYEPVNEADVDGMPIVDSSLGSSFLVDRIISLNVFGCPRKSLESHFVKATAKQEAESEAHHTSGIFIKASYINHSCDINARRSFIGDVQIIRASRNIPAGSEIFFWYAVPNFRTEYDEIQKKLETWGFKCVCAICEQNKKTKKSVLKRRYGLYEDLEAAFGSQKGSDLPKAERVLDAIEKTYPNRASVVPRLGLWDPYLCLARMYSAMNMQYKVIQIAWKVVESLGFVIKRQNPGSLTSAFEVEQWGLMDDHLVQVWVHLWTAYAQVAPDLCDKAKEYAKISYKICVGEDITFDEKYGKLARKAMFEGVELGQAFRAMTL